jgi:hypothetical protein
MKKSKLRLPVTLYQVKGQKNINALSDVLAIQLSSNQVSRGWEFSPSHNFGVLLSFNQVLRGREFSQSHDFSVTLSFNHILRDSKFNQSGLRRW